MSGQIAEESLPELHIPEEIKELIDDLSGEQKKVVIAILSYQSLAVESSTWKGPLPPPEILKGYNDAVSDGAERILRMTEKQAEHRMMIERATITEEQKQSGRGQVFGLIVAFAFLLASVYLIATGNGIYGTILGGVDIVALVCVFVYGKKQQDKD